MTDPPRLPRDTKWPEGATMGSSFLMWAPKHMLLIGAIVSEFAVLERMRFKLFRRLLSPLSLKQAEAAFFAVRMDRTREEVLNGILAAVVPDKKARKEIDAVHERIRRAADKRNAYAHSFIVGFSDDFSAFFTDKPGQPRAKVTIPDLEALLQDIHRLSFDYQQAIDWLEIPSPEKSA